LTAVTGIATDGSIALGKILIDIKHHPNHVTSTLLFRFVVGGGVNEAVLNYVTRATLEA